jgi:hypothetical protein
MRGNKRARQKFLKASEIPQGTSGHEQPIRHPFLEMPDQVLFFPANLLLFLTTLLNPTASLGYEPLG